jgi:hypothetical protein
MAMLTDRNGGFPINIVLGNENYPGAMQQETMNASRIYICMIPHTAGGSFDGSKFSLATSETIVPWVPYTNYDAGAQVAVSGVIYYRKSAAYQRRHGRWIPITGSQVPSRRWQSVPALVSVHGLCSRACAGRHRRADRSRAGSR